MNRTLGAFRPGSHPDHGDIGVVRFKSFEPFSRCERLIIEASLSFTPTRKPRFPRRGFRFCAPHQRNFPSGTASKLDSFYGLLAAPTPLLILKRPTQITVCRIRQCHRRCAHRENSALGQVSAEADRPGASTLSSGLIDLDPRRSLKPGLGSTNDNRPSANL